MSYIHDLETEGFDVDLMIDTSSAQYGGTLRSRIHVTVSDDQNEEFSSITVDMLSYEGEYLHVHREFSIQRLSAIKFADTVTALAKHAGNNLDMFFGHNDLDELSDLVSLLIGFSDRVVHNFRSSLR